MHVDAFLADSAEVINNKIYALGAGWATIYVRQFPAVHRRLTLAATVRVPFTETNEAHKLEVRLLTEDGKEHPIGLRMGEDGKPAPITAIAADFTLGRPPTLVDGDEQMACFAFPLDGMRFVEPGKFSWIITIDGDEVAQLAMRVQQQQQGR